VRTGTHVDAPVHFLDGADAVESLALDVLIGEAQVVEARGPGDIRRTPSRPTSGNGAVLFKTRNSDAWARGTFGEGFARLSVEAAELLAAAGVRLVGVDYLSVGGAETHRTRSRPVSSRSRGSTSEASSRASRGSSACRSSSSGQTARPPVRCSWAVSAPKSRKRYCKQSTQRGSPRNDTACTSDRSRRR
jgi:hypothetical protein